MEKTPQSFKNHAKVDPALHFFLAPLALILAIAAIYNLVKDPRTISVFYLLAAIWALVATFKMRLYSLKVQDRVIRLEERLRLEKLLSRELNSRAAALTESQLIALRFASDAELAALVEKALSGNLPPKSIKESIQNWRPDYWRV